MLLKSLGLAIGIQAAFGIPGAYYKSEKYYDFSGAVTHIALVLFSMRNGVGVNTHTIIANAISIGWAARLGGFLAYRMYKLGEDTRFEKIKENKLRFLNAWFLQALWCTLIQTPLILMNAYSPVRSLSLLDKVLAGGWISSVCLEALADKQKWSYKANRKETDPGFTCTGLWKYSQHPNYFFEISSWTFAWLYTCRNIGLSNLAIGAVSPAFTATLLLFVSGIPMSKTKQKYGSDSRYADYEKSTSEVIPWFPKSKSQ